MQIGVVGLGRMGGNIARRLMRAGHATVVFDANPKAAESLGADGAEAAASLADLVQRMHGAPRAVWVMLPAGQITESTVATLGDLLARDDIVIDGGNTYFRDDIRRATTLAAKGVRYMDVGTSGGVWGLERGYCLMIGGDVDAFAALKPIFAALAPGRGAIAPTPGRDALRNRDEPAEQGYLYTGPVGSGHFVKMVHNGIEYGLMQAYAEGFDILRSRANAAVPAAEKYDLNLADIAEVWRRGSVVTSWLLDLTASALADDGQLARFSGYVQDSGEGRWTIEAALEEAVPAEVLSAALYTRFRSRQEHTFAEKVLSAMRLGFGGHIELGGKT
jgi:6-phosphogluconate dehydrogenase